MGIFKLHEMNVDLLRLNLDGDYDGHDNENLMISINAKVKLVRKGLDAEDCVPDVGWP